MITKMPTLLLALSMLLVGAAPAEAATQATPGAIARVDVPADFQAHYEPTADVTALWRGTDEQILLCATPALDPQKGMHQLLEIFGASHLAPQVETARLAGYDGVKLDVVGTVHERWYVLSLEGASLVVRAASTNSFEALASITEATVKSLQLAPATLPRLVAGSYETNVAHSDTYGGGPSVYMESGIDLQPDGTLRQAGFVGASGGFGSMTSESSGTGRWEVRGNRLLMLTPDGTASNFRVAAFSNGLELWDTDGTQLLWVRR